MTKITLLPHPEISPQGTVIQAQKGVSLCKSLLDNKIEIEHACDMSCACTTCHIIVREGFDNIEPASEDEEDKLDRAWGLHSQSRLACQVIVGDQELTIEIPKYTVNHAKEG